MPTPKLEPSQRKWRLADLPIRTPSLEELAYCAGIIDGEGSVGVGGRSPKNPQSFAIKVTVQMTTSQAVSLLHEVFGGRKFIPNRVTKTGKTIYAWSVYCSRAGRVLEQLVPYLRVKKTVAEDCIALTKFYKQGRQHSISDAERHARDTIFNRLSIHSLRVHKGPKPVAVTGRGSEF